MPGSPFLLKNMSGTITMQGFTIPSFTYAEKRTNFGLKMNFDKLWNLKPLELEMWVKGTRSWWMLEEYVKEDY